MGRRANINNERNDDLRKTLRDNPNKRQGRRVNIKAIIIGIVVIAVIVAVVIAIQSNLGKNVSYEEVTQYDYFITSIGGKAGVIDKEGNVVINAEYDLIQIPNPSKPIFICLYDYNTDTREYNSKVLNENGDEIYTNYSGIQAIPNNNTSSQNSYQTGILRYKQDGKYGLLNINGRKITDAIYDSIETLEYKDGILKVSQEGKFGLISLNGDEIVKPEYDSIATDGYYNQDTKYEAAGYIVNVRTDEGYRYGYINSEGKQILDTMYTSLKRITEIKDDENVYLITYRNGLAGLLRNGQTIIDNEYEDIEYDSTNNILALQKNAKQGVYDLSGNMILPIQYDSIEFMGIYINAIQNNELLVFNTSGTIQDSNGYKSMTPVADSKYYITIDRNNNYGVLDSNRNIIIPSEYSYIEYAFDRYFIVTQNELSGVLDDTANIVIPLQYNVVQNISGTNIIQTINSETNTSEIYNRNIEKVITQENAHVYIEGDYIEISCENNIQYTDLDGNIKDATEIFPNNTVFAKQQDGKWGYVDKNGNTVVDFIYDLTTNINEYGFGAVKLNGKWGVVNSNGEVIKEPTYELTDIEPNFIGEYYEVSNIYQIPYYSNEVTNME